MASKPKSALASLMDAINNSEQDQAAAVEADVVIPNVDESIENSSASPNINFTSHKSQEVKVDTSRLMQIDPNDCHLWKFADRPEGELGDIQSLALSMKENGQQEPILIRPNAQKTEHKYEVIFGNRRWRAAISEGLSLQAMFKSVTDQEAALFQKEENENRKDLSDYARAMSYKNQIESGVFKSERELSKLLHLSRQTLNDIMAYIRVPQHIINAIPNYSEISRATAVKLSALARDRTLHDTLIRLGPRIGNRTITASNIELELNRKYLQRSKIEAHDIINAQGRKIGKLKQHPTGTIGVSIDAKFSGQIDINQLCKHIADQCNYKEK